MTWSVSCYPSSAGDESARPAHQRRRPREDVRHARAGTRAGSGRHLPGHRHWRVRHHRRPVGLRQDHVAEDPGRPDPELGGHGQSPRPARARPQPRHRHRVPGSGPAAMAHGAAQRAPARAGAPPGRARGARARDRAASSGRPGGLRGQVSPRAVGRHAPARRDRPGPHSRPVTAADGRAIRRARRDDAPVHEPGAAAHLAGSGQDHHLHHPLDPRGRVPGRPRGGDVGATRSHPGDRDRGPAAPPRSRPDGLGRVRYLRQEGPPPVRRQGLARLMPMRQLWRDFVDDPAYFLRSRPQLVLIPAVFVLFVACWEWVVRQWSVPAFIAPAPSAVTASLVGGIRSGVYLEHFWVTLGEALAGFGIAAVTGIALGALIAQSRLVERTVYPYLVALQTLPKIAIAPLIIVWAGFGLSSKVIIAALVAFFPVLVNVIVGLKTIDQSKLELMRSLRASRWQTFRLVTFPNALPFVFAGLDIAIVFSVLGAIVGEFVGAQRGLGNLILQFNVTLDIAGVFAVLIMLAVLGIALHLAMQAVERRVIFWAQPEEVIGA